VMDTTSKHLVQTFSAFLLVWARYSVHCLLMIVFLTPSFGGALLYTNRLGLQIVRALLLLSCSTLTILALRTMPLAEATGLSFVSPLLATLLAGPWLGEKVGKASWIAILAGAIGAALVARPDGTLPVAGVLLTLGAALCFAVYQILTRQLSRTETSVSMLFYTALAGAVCMNLALPWLPLGPLPTWPQALLILSLGVFGGCGHYLVIQAFRMAPVSTLSPFVYFNLVWTTLLGWIVFGDLPDAWSVAGIAIIAASGMGLMLARRATVQRKLAADVRTRIPD